MLHSRRNFLKTAGSLTVGFCFVHPLIGATNQTPRLPGDLADFPRIDSWIEILDNGLVRILTGKTELGQGIRTAVAQVAAPRVRVS